MSLRFVLRGFGALDALRCGSAQAGRQWQLLLRRMAVARLVRRRSSDEAQQDALEQEAI